MAMHNHGSSKEFKGHGARGMHGTRNYMATFEYRNRPKGAHSHSQY